jgi:DtxR family transcriptional regulator, Mn-dependent transcriptional regulator
MSSLSLTEENYLKIIFIKFEQSNGQEVNTNDLALHTQTKAASVTDMLKKLAEKDLINYKKYQGVSLTELGQKHALKVIRKHRLWEFFLVERLGFGWDEVHHIAEQLEHIDSEELTNKLDDFLGNPKFDPHGDPIPDANGVMPQLETKALADVAMRKTVVMVGVSIHSSSFLKHLDLYGLNLGSQIQITAINEFDKSHQISINQQAPIFVSFEVAKNILVR